MESGSSGRASRSPTFSHGGEASNFPARRRNIHHAGGNGGKAVVLLKNREGRNIIAEIIFAVLQEGREGIDVERVLTHMLAGQSARSQVRLVETLRHG